METGKLTLLLIYSALGLLSSCGQVAVKKRVLVAFYNCENLFDTVHNPAARDEEFTPGGIYHYTQKIYEQKLHNIATVIQSMSENGNLAAMGLAEVENDIVLRDLIAQPELARFKYSYILYNGHDERGINVAIIYSPEYFKPLASESLPVNLDSVKPVAEGSKMNTRDILHVKGILWGDTVHLFVNHWPSRTDGDTESRVKRIAAAVVARKAIDQLLSADSSTRILVMGDFNDNPDDSSLAKVIGADQSNKSEFFNPFMAICNKGEGTEMFNHRWNLFDQIIISNSLFNRKTKGLNFDSAGVYKPDFLTDHHPGHEGTPCRAWMGTYWLNGYSDHFPVLLYLKKEEGNR